MKVNIPYMDPSWGMSFETNSNAATPRNPGLSRETTHATVAKNLGGFGNLWMEGWTEAGTLEVLPSLKLTSNRTYKWMVGIRSFPIGFRPIFRGYVDVSFREGYVS